MADKQENRSPTGPIGTSMLTIRNSGAVMGFNRYAMFQRSDMFISPISSSDKPLMIVDHISGHGLDTTKAAEGSPTVRFASVNEEIAPDSYDNLNSTHPTPDAPSNDDQKLRELSQSLQGSHLQGRRMSHFAFEPVSLPASRVCQLHFTSIAVQIVWGKVAADIGMHFTISTYRLQGTSRCSGKILYVPASSSCVH